MSRSRFTALEGVALLILFVVALTAAAGTAFWMATEPVDGARAAIRLTARTSLLLFLLAFTASATATLVPCRFSRWQRRNRRYLGLGFAASHALHLGAIGLLFRFDPALFDALTTNATLISGSVAYAFILLMAATSFDAAVRWLGPRRWRILHMMGAWYLWVSFVIAFGKRVPGDLAYGAGVALLLLALGLKIGAWVKQRRARANVERQSRSEGAI